MATKKTKWAYHEDAGVIQVDSSFYLDVRSTAGAVSAFDTEGNWDIYPGYQLKPSTVLEAVMEDE